MIDIKAAVSDILENFDDSDYPLDFLKQYVLVECIACSHGTETFIVRKKDGNKYYVAKCYDKNIYQSVHEGEILKPLLHDGLPLLEDEFQNDRMICIVREYITGKPLDQYVKESILTKQKVIDICISLTDILIYLHEQKEPVIHRDIKPSNIIVKPDGGICLIDFDISRTYRSDAKADTQCFGTREFAPPEQYGFSQTDPRTDIYSFGVVMGWMLTGELNSQDVLMKLGRDRVVNIYKKCTAFSPDNRFSSAKKLKASLLPMAGNHKKAALGWTAAVLSSLIFLCTGFFIGRNTDFLSDRLIANNEVIFEEPMIEQAVRLQLGKTAEEIITEEELGSITGIYIFGASLIAKNENELHAEANNLFENNRMQAGYIHSLTDLTKMPKLKQIFICMQDIEDISQLTDLKNLEVVDLKNNPITDISPMGELKFLKRVCLFDTRITDLSPLANCPMLIELDAGKLPLRTPAAFEGLNHLQSLNLNETTLDTLTGIENLSYLKDISVEGVIDEDLTPLLSLQYLKNVILGEDMQNSAEAIKDRADFTISYQ